MVSALLMICVTCMIICEIMPVTNAGYEHNCTLSMLQSGYRGPNSVCSGALMEHVYLVCYAKKKKRRNVVPQQRLSNKTIKTINFLHKLLSRERNSQAESEIFNSRLDANKFLSKRNMYDTYSYYYGEYGNYDGAYYSQNGIVCECCIYGCTPTELSEYCAYKRRKRSVSSSRVPEYFRDFFEDGFEDDFQNYIFEDPVEFSRTSIVQALDQQKALNIKHEN